MRWKTKTSEELSRLEELYGSLSADERNYIADRWDSGNRLFGGLSRTRRRIIIAIPAIAFFFWFGQLLQKQSARQADSIVLNYLRDASVKDGNRALLPALREADEYYDALTRNARVEYEDSKQ